MYQMEQLLYWLTKCQPRCWNFVGHWDQSMILYSLEHFHLCRWTFCEHYLHFRPIFSWGSVKTTYMNTGLDINYTNKFVWNYLQSIFIHVNIFLSCSQRHHNCLINIDYFLTHKQKHKSKPYLKISKSSASRSRSSVRMRRRDQLAENRKEDFGGQWW